MHQHHKQMRIVGHHPIDRPDLIDARHLLAGDDDDNDGCQQKEGSTISRSSSQAMSPYGLAGVSTGIVNHPVSRGLNSVP